MEQITARALRTVEWKQVYAYDSDRRGGTSFVTYASDGLPGLTITKEKRGGSRKTRTTTIYQFKGRKTDSPTQAVRMWNEEAKRLAGGGSAASGSAEQVKAARRTTSI